MSSSLARRASFGGPAQRLLTQGIGEAELRLLRAFLAAVEAGGLSAAAVELQIDLSTVSRQFRELEAWLGVPLARRGRSGFSLTPAGEQLHVLTREWFGTTSDFADNLTALGAASRPLLRLGVVDALVTAQGCAGAGHVPRLLARLIDAEPGVRLNLRTMRPVDIEREVLAGSLDGGILAARPPAAGLAQYRLYSERSSLYVAPGHPCHADPERELDEDGFRQLALVTDPYFDSIPLPGLATLFAANARIRADSIEGVALLVSTGRFAGYLPDHVVQETRALSALRSVCPGRVSYQQDIVLTCHAGNVAPLIRCLIRWIEDLAPGADTDGADAPANET
ncbi:LysR family transcriptional regulator [Hydrogenophaga palleronii]|uniref:LysR family transcriptional regulator n=1 Tax=Hydrogenophaga palleronii TaxID=65655 RepID=UPI000A8245D9|nr:LysR family transcriptional regulator [Hydrogenophaga palleronii]